MLAVRMYNVVVTLTPAMKKDLMGSVKLPANSIRLIANGTPEIRFGTGEREKARRALGIEDAAFVVGFAGRFDLVKDLDTLVTGFARFSEGEPSSRLVLVGDGPCADHLRDLVRTCAIEHKVIFTGFSDKVQLVMHTFDVSPASLYRGAFQYHS